MADAGPASFDPAEAMLQVGDDVTLLRELMHLFVQEAAQREADVRMALERRDAKLLARAAHSIKGACAVFGATATWSAADRLETLGREGDLEGAPEALAQLSTETARLILDLRAYLDSGPA